MDQANRQNELLMFQQGFSKLEQDQARLQKIRQPQVKRTRIRTEDLLNTEQRATRGCGGNGDNEQVICTRVRSIGFDLRTLRLTQAAGIDERGAAWPIASHERGQAGQPARRGWRLASSTEGKSHSAYLQDIKELRSKERMCFFDSIFTHCQVSALHTLQITRCDSRWRPFPVSEFRLRSQRRAKGG